MFKDSGRCGEFVTVHTEQNVAKVKYLIKEDPRITENEIKDILYLLLRSSDRIFLHHLDVRKRCACWVLHQLTEEQSRGREWCFHMPRKFDAGRSERVWNIVTGNETSAYYSMTRKLSSGLQSVFSPVRARL